MSAQPELAQIGEGTFDLASVNSEAPLTLRPLALAPGAWRLAPGPEAGCWISAERLCWLIFRRRSWGSYWPTFWGLGRRSTEPYTGRPLACLRPSPWSRTR